MPASTQASADDIDITSIWGALKRSARKLVLASILIGAATYAVLTTVAPRYTSEAQLSIVAKETANPFTSPKGDVGSPEALGIRMDKEAVNTHVRALMSPDLASGIAGELNLAGRTEFNSALGPHDVADRIMRLAGVGGPRAGESERDRVLGSYFKRLEVYSPKESRFIGIRFTSSDPDLAAEIANKLADTYRETLAKQTVVETDEVQKALEPKIVRLRDEVQQAEAEVERFKGDKDLFKGGPQRTGLNEQQLGELTAELTKAKAARSEAEARARSARDMMRTGSADALPDVQKSPLIQSLVQQRVRLEREISELSATLLPGHPRMRQLEADLSGLRRQISAEIMKLVDSLEKEAKVAALREASVAQSLEEVKSQVVTTSTSEVELRALETVAKTKRSELERLQAQFEANRARADSRVVPVEAQIISKARVSSVPVFPKKGSYAALAAAATLLLGIAWTVTRALLLGARQGYTAASHPKRRASDRAAPAVELPSAADRRVVTATSRDEAKQDAPSKAASAVAALAEELPLAKVQGEVTELATVSRLARHIRDVASGKGGFRTLIAGETNVLDPSTEAIELAEELVRDGMQVVVIDWSTGGSGFAERLGLSPAAGIVDLMRGDASFEDVIQNLPGSQAHAIAAGSSLDPDGPDDQIDAERLNLLLDALDEAYDHIVVVGVYEEARLLFEAIQGRFDAGITVGEAKHKTKALSDPPGTFLGFEVTDIELVRLSRSETKAQPAQRFLRRGGSAHQFGAAQA